jgi:hypothetical protein
MPQQSWKLLSDHFTSKISMQCTKIIPSLVFSLIEMLASPWPTKIAIPSNILEIVFLTSELISESLTAASAALSSFFPSSFTVPAVIEKVRSPFPLESVTPTATAYSILILPASTIPWPLAWLCMVHGNFPISLCQRSSSRGTVFYK